MDITSDNEILKSVIAAQIVQARESATPTEAELAARKEAEIQAKKKKPPIKGITQEELAARMGVDRNLVKHWEIGDREIKASGLKAVAEALNVSIDWLLDPSKSPSRNEDVAAIEEYTGLDTKSIETLHQIKGTLANEYLNYFLYNPKALENITVLIRKVMLSEAKVLIARDEQDYTILDNDDISVSLGVDETHRWFVSRLRDEIAHISNMAIQCVMFSNNHLRDIVHDAFEAEEQEFLDELSPEDREMYAAAKKRYQEKRPAR